MEVEPAALQASPQPPDALLNLRSQCENQQKQQQLYAKKPDNWLVCAQSRSTFFAQCPPSTEPYGLVLRTGLEQGAGGTGQVRLCVGQGGLHGVQLQACSSQGIPRVALSYRHASRCMSWDTLPRLSVCSHIAGYACWQRVGIVRKLRWGTTLKRDAPGAYRLDMTEARFKNSRARTSRNPQPFRPRLTMRCAIVCRLLRTFRDVDQRAHRPRSRPVCGARRF
jgi:hypothetical protein